MKKIILSLLIIVASCTNNDDGDFTKPTEPEVVNKNVYSFSNSFNIVDLNYYKGDKGNEYPTEAESFFNSQWSFYSDPSIKTISFSNDSITINENLSIKKFKYNNENNIISVKENGNDLILGYLDAEKETFKLYKNFKSYYVLLNEETNETLFSRSSEYGKINYNNIFPHILNNPKELTNKNEYIFWSNIEYIFN
jgi:hypothetical protein